MSATLMSQNGNGLEALPNMSRKKTQGSNGEIENECDWREYTKGQAWDFYLVNGRNISGCSACMKQCQNDPNCQTVECGEDQDLPDGTIKYAHCSWWNKTSCYKYEEYTLNPNNYIWTCRRKGM